MKFTLKTSKQKAAVGTFKSNSCFKGCVRHGSRGPYLLDRVLGAISYNLAKCGTGKALLYHFVEAVLQ